MHMRPEYEPLGDAPELRVTALGRAANEPFLATSFWSACYNVLTRRIDAQALKGCIARIKKALA